MAAFPEHSFRARHTRGLERELESIQCSALNIRSPRLHVPLRFLRAASRPPRNPRAGSPGMARNDGLARGRLTGRCCRRAEQFIPARA